MKEFQIKRSGIKRYLYILLSLIMTAASALMLISQRSVIIGLIGLLFFGLGTIVIVWKTFGPPLLILTAEGFTDNSTASPAGFIPWEAVSRLAIVEIMRQTFITVYLEDTGAYLDTLSPLKRNGAKNDIAMGYGPINIALLGTGMRPEDVLSRMMEFWTVSRNGTQSPALSPPAIDNTAQNG